VVDFDPGGERNPSVSTWNRVPAASFAGYGHGSASVDAGTRRLLDPRYLLFQTQGRYSDPTHLPTVIPAVARQLATLSQRPGVARAEALRLFEQAPLLAGYVLRAASAVVNRPLRSFAEVWGAVGSQGTHKLLVRLSRKGRVVGSDEIADAMARLARHSAAVARISRLLARHTPFAAEYAWWCGLLHDAGFAAMLAGLAEAPGGPGLPLEDLLPVLDEAHIRATTMVTRRCGLPEDLVLGVSQHHNPFGVGPAHPLAAVVCVADHMAGVIGFPSWSKSGSSLAVDQSGTAMVARARDVLALPDSTWHAVRRDVRGLCADLRG